MGEVACWAILIWCICAIKSSASEDVDYWYSNDDGLSDILEIPSAQHFRSHLKNKTSLNVNLVRQHNYNSTQEDQKRNLVRLFNIDKANLRNGAQSLRTQVEQDSVIRTLQRQINSKETESCTDGLIKVTDCSQCLCVGGQLYVCTVTRCSAPNSNGNSNGDVQLKKPNCIDGERVKSFDCNRCWCVGGEVFCTRKGCGSFSSKPRLSSSHDEESCIPGEPVPSPDGCNICGCNKRGEIFCSAMSCGHRPKINNDAELNCAPEAWYSLQKSKTCKECYCTDGRYAFCYMSLCAAEKSLGYSPIKLMAKQTANCKKGSIIKDRCTHCHCTFKEEWKCSTRLVDSCSEKEPKPSTASTDKRGKKRLSNSRIHVTKKHQQTITKIPGDNEVGSDDNDYGEPSAPHMPPGGACKDGAFFTQSLNATCQGCFCTAGQWKCFSVASACHGYNTRKCKPGTYRKNRSSACSVCMCGADGTYICATDEKCALMLKKSNCKMTVCSFKCLKKGSIYGFCLRGKCICV